MGSAEIRMWIRAGCGRSPAPISINIIFGSTLRILNASRAAALPRRRPRPSALAAWSDGKMRYIIFMRCTTGIFRLLRCIARKPEKGLMVSCHSVLYALELSRTFSLDLPLQLLQQFSLSEISRIARAWRKHQRQDKIGSIRRTAALIIRSGRCSR